MIYSFFLYFFLAFFAILGEPCVKFFSLYPLTNLA